ncbi:MAG TPA: translation elongation factor G [Eubacterium sp.]|nr:translation elongation factor G [Eubacterium sp.]
MKKITLGILAHVDAGKTTLSENILYRCRVINSPGRVDNRDTFLDTDPVERLRGITVYSKEARFTYEGVSYTLIDTPGHSDFYKDLERSLYALDAAILVISASEGVQAHTRLLYSACKKLSIPVYIYINKMDMPGVEKSQIMTDIRQSLMIDNPVDMSLDYMEEFSVVSEEYIEKYLDGRFSEDDVADIIEDGLAVPVYAGSALKGLGVEELLHGLSLYSRPHDITGADSIVIRIKRSSTMERMTYVKVLKGSVEVRGEYFGEKISQIRQYNGERYECVDRLEAGDTGYLLGPEKPLAGMCIRDGIEDMYGISMATPVISVAVTSKDTDDILLMRYLKEYEVEEPSLNVSKGSNNKDIIIDVMGKMYLDVLKGKFKERFHIELEYSKIRVLYKETIRGSAMGLGHFEPLRHYAHVELELIEGAYGSGIEVVSEVSEDIIDKNYQANILNSLMRYRHKGILTGSQLTDVKIVLRYARAHKKHTSGADFYEASKRAVRCALNFADNVLLEPYYDFEIELPFEALNRLTFDLNNMGAETNIGVEGDIAIVTGSAPVICLSDYMDELKSYTKGCARMYLADVNYRPCHNTEEVVRSLDYRQSFDVHNTSDSVICEGGASKVIDYMSAIDRYGFYEKESTEDVARLVKSTFIGTIGTDEIDEIMSKTGGQNKGRDVRKVKKTVLPVATSGSSKKVYKAKEKYLVVDGYNVIHAFADLKELMEVSLDAARGALLDKMSNYRGYVGYPVMVVFDAYRVKGGTEHVETYNGNVLVVYTKEAQTADHFIECFARVHAADYDITVVTSDGLEQSMVRGYGCTIISSREFEQLVGSASIL